MKIKICGITNREDLKTAEKYADLIGFINIKRSKRFLNLEEIGDLVSLMENKDKAVLVLENDDIQKIQHALKVSGIKIAQFHGFEERMLSELQKKSPEIQIIKVIGLSESMNYQKIAEIKESSKICDFILFDYELNGLCGGTGFSIPLNLALNASAFARSIDYQGKLLLAGGINAERIESVGEILEEYYDYVDVNSGVEESPGIKSENKIKELFKVIT